LPLILQPFDKRVLRWTRYVYFPGTQGDSAFFENNDQILLARVDKGKILDRSAYEFFNGIQLDGSTPS
jgi:hypothetical protein